MNILMETGNIEGLWALLAVVGIGLLLAYGFRTVRWLVRKIAKI